MAASSVQVQTEITQAQQAVGEATFEGNLETATQGARNPMVERVLALRARVNEVNEDGETALHLAVRSDNYMQLVYVLNLGARVNEANKDGNAALHLAAMVGNSRMVDQLVGEGASLNKANKDGNTPLLLAAQGGHTSLVERLSDYGASLTEVNKNGMTALLLAANNGHVPVVQRLLGLGASLAEVNYSGDTALLAAAYHGHISMVEWLLGHGASLTEVNKYGNTALLLATLGGHIPMVAWLLGHGASLIEVNQDGDTALLTAALGGHISIVEWLLDHGANLAEVDEEGYSTLRFAVYGGRMTLLNWLMGCDGAGLAEIDKDSDTALFWANRKAHTMVIQYLTALTSAQTEFNQSLILQRIFPSYRDYFLQTHYHELDAAIKAKLHGGRPAPLTVLNLDSYVWTSGDLLKLSQLLHAFSSSLTHLSLAGCQLTSEHLTALDEAVTTLSALTHLDLSDNPGMGDAGFQLLSRWMRQLPSLIHLQLRATGLSQDGLTEFLKAARQLSLQQLDIRHNAVYMNAPSTQRLIERVNKTTLKDVEGSVCVFGNYFLRDTKTQLTEQAFFGGAPPKEHPDFAVSSLFLSGNTQAKISYDNALVFLCRNKRGDEQHAMLIIEGIYGFGQRFLQRYDFRPTDMRRGEVRSCELDPIRLARDLEGYRYKAYPCPRLTLKTLIRHIKADEDKILFYDKSGVAGLSKGRVYNCYTWALDRLIGVGLERQKAEPRFIAVPSLLLRGQSVHEGAAQSSSDASSSQGPSPRCVLQ